MATPAEIAAKKQQEAQRKIQAAAADTQLKAAQAKLATYGSQANIDFTKAVAPKFSKMAEIAERITAKAPTRPDVLKAQGITLDQLKEKTATVQTGATKYTADATGITQAEEELATAQGLVNQYATPIDIPTEDPITTDRRDAFALIKSTLSTYGFTQTEIAELDAFIESVITDVKIGPELAKIKLREQPTYQARFAGNKGRVAKGFNALSEAQYLQQETDYAQTLSSYGVGQLSSRSQFATLIENNTSVTEVGRRLNASVRRVKNADPTILENLKRLYPTITDTDIVSYFLKPVETIEELERKTTVAEIGATAQQYKMKETGLAKFEDLQRYGVTLETARKGYSTIAEELPDATKLGNIYSETGITYGQTEAEAEQFKDSAEAKRKKQKLIETEKASFKGSAGVGDAGLSTQYLRRGSSAGQF